ncbi:MAG: sulfatase-like hydrolase/transferase [Acidobacteriota bacterium]
MKRQVDLVFFLYLGLGCVASGCGEDSTGSVHPPPPTSSDVILISIDTLRADHLSSYGYSLSTPHLDQLAEDGILFEQAITPVPLTLPAHASLLTGTYPLFHGVRDNSGFTLPNDQLTLAEVLQSSGFRTGAFIGAFVLDSRFGLNQGFQEYFDHFDSDTLSAVNLEISERRAEEVLRRAQEWIAQGLAGPFFCWIHLYDPHAPYHPPEAFRSSTRSDYDGEIAYVDRQIGDFFRFLRQNRLYDSSLIVLTSDHGEGLGDHGESTHGMFLYDSTLRVPLILKPPFFKKKGQRIDRQVRLIDVMPTILQILAVRPPPSVQGVGLATAWLHDEVPESPAFSETMLPLLNYGWSPLEAYRAGGMKFIDAPRPELYDLRTDSREHNNLIDRRSSLAHQLKEKKETLVERYTGRDLEGAHRAVDQETVERLRSLGYATVAAGRRSDSMDRSGRPDPKDKIELFNRIWEAQEASLEGRFQESSQLLEQVLRKDASIFMAHSIQALNLLQLNRVREARDHLQRASQLRPDDPGSHFYLGIASLRLGELARSEREFKATLELDPGHDAALNNLGTVYIREKKFEQATGVFEKVSRKDPDDVACWVNLGVAHLLQGEEEIALEKFQRALQLDPQLPQVRNNIGLIYLNRGDAHGALTHLQEAIRLKPGYASALLNLARAYELGGEPDKAAQIRKQVQQKEDP